MAYKVFLSVGSSFNNAQEEFIKAIETYLKDNDLLPQTVGRTYFSSLQPLKAVNELMQECYGTIILALERSYLIEAVDKRDSPKQVKFNGVKLTTPWNQIEAAMAYTHGHPLLVVVESGVKSEGLLERGYDWYVLEVDAASPLVNDPAFVGVIADWKKRVIQFAKQQSLANPAEQTVATPVAKTADPAKPTPTTINLGELRRNMLEAFNDDELEDICFDMEINYESLRGESKNAKMREVIALCERNGRLAELIENCRILRPHLKW